MRLTAVLLAAALVAAMPACATTGSAQMQSDLDAIQNQLWKIQKDNAALLDQVKALQSAPRGETGAPALAELRVRLDAAERQLQALATRATETDERLRQLAGQLRSARETVDGLGRAGAPAEPGRPPYGAAPPLSPASGVTAGAAGAAGEAHEGAAPGAAPSPESLLRIGDDYLGRRLFQEAVTAFDEIIRDPAAPQEVAAAAYLKKGLALLELNRTADAVVHLQHVAAAYPGTEEARTARERLRALGIAGP